VPEMCERGFYSVLVVRVKADDKADSVLENVYENFTVKESKHEPYTD